MDTQLRATGRPIRRRVGEAHAREGCAPRVQRESDAPVAPTRHLAPRAGERWRHLRYQLLVGDCGWDGHLALLVKQKGALRQQGTASSGACRLGFEGARDTRSVS